MVNGRPIGPYGHLRSEIRTARPLAAGRVLTYSESILRFGGHSTEGGSVAVVVSQEYPGVTGIVRMERAGKPPGVAVAPEEDARLVRAALAPEVAAR